MKAVAMQSVSSQRCAWHSAERSLPQTTLADRAMHSARRCLVSRMPECTESILKMLKGVSDAVQDHSGWLSPEDRCRYH